MPTVNIKSQEFEVSWEDIKRWDELVKEGKAGSRELAAEPELKKPKKVEKEPELRESKKARKGEMSHA